MSFVGNRNGPRKSEIVSGLGPDYFGISTEELAIEVELYKSDEFRGEVDPVYIDQQGRYYLLFNAPGGGQQKYFLEKNGYHLEGNVFVVKEGETRILHRSR